MNIKISKELTLHIIHNKQKHIFYILLVIILLFMVISAPFFGLCWDEQIMKTYGENALRYLMSFGKEDDYINNEKIVRLYGGGVEITAAMLTNNINADPYSVRHVYIAIYGFVTIFFCGLTAREFGNWRTAILGVLFLFLSPVFVGNSMFNSKDIPFACGYTIGVYYIIRYLKSFPEIRSNDVLGLASGIALGISIRVGALLLIAYLLFFFTIQLIISAKKTGLNTGKFLSLRKRNILYTLLIIISGYLGGILFWPYAMANPIVHPIEALQTMSAFPMTFNNLFNGTIINSASAPWYYIPVWILITSPLFILFALIVFPFSFFQGISKPFSTTGFYLFVLLFSAIFPVAYVIFSKANLYDGWRHLLFIYPSLAAFCAIILDKFITSVSSRKLKLILIFILSITLIEPFLWICRNHKLEQFYFSPIIGGTNGAFKKFEIDYYGTSLRYAVEWIAENQHSLKKSSDGKIRVRQWYGETFCTTHFINKYDNLEFVSTEKLSGNWDYDIVLPTRAKYETDLLTKWPPKGMVHLIEADDGPVVAIVENVYTSIADKISSIYTESNPSVLINLSLELYNNQDYLNCILACEKALTNSPGNKAAYNNITAALNNLGMKNEAIEYAETGLKIDPSFDLLKANYNEALKILPPVTPEEKNKMAVNYINLGLVYYNLEQFEKSIALTIESVNIIPNNSLALNNIGAAYNRLHQYDKAKIWLEKAIQIDPNNQLAKNNLEESILNVKSMGKQ